MHMDEELDQGDIISQEEIDILNEDTASTLHDKLSLLGRDLLLKTLPSIIDGTAPRVPQDKSEVTYAFNLKKKMKKLIFIKQKTNI